MSNLISIECFGIIAVGISPLHRLDISIELLLVVVRVVAMSEASSIGIYVERKSRPNLAKQNKAK